MEQIWRQTSIPVIYRRGKGYPLLIKLPYRDDNRIWLQNGKRNKPKWLKQYTCWEVPKAWFDDLVNRSNNRWNSLYIIQPYAPLENHYCMLASETKSYANQSFQDSLEHDQLKS